MTTMNIYQVNAHPDMQCNEDQSQWSIACPTHNQCKIHEVLHLGIKIQLGHKCEVLKTY